jgi:vacuolar-type H+-ATPase subunit I/STV1
LAEGALPASRVAPPASNKKLRLHSKKKKKKKKKPTLAQWKACCLAMEAQGNAGVMAEQLKAIDLRATIAAYRCIITQAMPLAKAQRLLATVPKTPIKGDLEVTNFHTAIVARIEHDVEFFMGEHEELQKNNSDLAQLLEDESASHLATTAKYVETVETLTQREEMLENLQATNERLTDLVVRLEPRTEFQEEQIATLLLTVEEKKGEIAELRKDQETAAKEHAAVLAEQDQQIATATSRFVIETAMSRCKRCNRSCATSTRNWAMLIRL